MEEYDNYVILARFNEEYELYKARTPSPLNLDEMSVIIHNNEQYLRNYRSKPDRHTLKVRDLYYLHKHCGFDDTYLLTGIRFRSLVKSKLKS